MEQFKKAVIRILTPPIWFRWVLAVASFIFVGAIFLLRLHGTAIGYIAYLISSLGLYYLITVTLVPLFGKIKGLLLRNRHIRRYYEDAEFHARVKLYSSTTFNVLYALFKLVTGLVLGSIWIIAIAGYYISVTVIRFSLVYQDARMLRRNVDRDIESEWKNYRRAGFMLLLISFAFAGIVLRVVLHKEGYTYPGMFIFVMAVYAFYSIITAIIRLFKGRNNRNPIFSAAKVIDVSVAVVAMYALQTAMFSSFSPDLDVRIPNMITGTAVIIIVTGLAVMMLIRSTQRLYRKNGTEEDG